jgi:hypothetical protein
VGVDLGSPVSARQARRRHFPFTGKTDKMTFELSQWHQSWVRTSRPSGTRQLPMLKLFLPHFPFQVFIRD